MNKLELVETLKEETGITKNEASVVVKMFFDEMSAALANGKRVEIRGLCSFYVKHYKAYTGRNPKNFWIKDNRIIVTLQIVEYSCGIIDFLAYLRFKNRIIIVEQDIVELLCGSVFPPDRHYYNSSQKYVPFKNPP